MGRIRAAILITVLVLTLAGCSYANPELRQHHGKIKLKDKPKGAPDAPEWCFDVQNKRRVFICRWDSELHQWVVR